MGRESHKWSSHSQLQDAYNGHASALSNNHLLAGNDQTVMITKPSQCTDFFMSVYTLRHFICTQISLPFCHHNCCDTGIDVCLISWWQCHIYGVISMNRQFYYLITGQQRSSIRQYFGRWWTTWSHQPTKQHHIINLDVAVETKDNSSAMCRDCSWTTKPLHTCWS